MTIRLEPKRPAEKRRYTHDWSAFLGADTIASQTTTSPDVTITGAVLNGTQKVDFTVDGGTDGEFATITQSIVTAAGDHETEIFVILVRSSDEPVTLTEAKAQLRIVDDTSEDALILSYIIAARNYVESESGFVFVRRQFIEAFSYWPTYLSINRRPLISVDSVDYVDADGLPQTVDVADYYIALALRRVTPVASWPSLGVGGAISVTYTAGFAEGEQTEEVELARQAILLIVGHWYNARETVSINNVQVSEIPFAARALIDRFRVMLV